MIAAAIALVTALSASPALAVDYNHVYKLPIDTCLRENLAASGDIITWLREPAGDLDSSQMQAAYFDVRTGRETILPDVHVPPVPSGNRLAYVKQRVVGYWRNGDPITENSVHVWDMDTQAETTIAVAASPSDWVGDVALDGDLVLWQYESGDSSSTTYGRNLVTGREFTIATDSWQTPAVSNGWVVYTSSRHSTNSKGNEVWDDDIKAYEVASGRRYTVVAHSNPQNCPSIGPTGLVAWQDFRGDKNPNDGWNDSDVYGCYLRDRKVFAIASGPGNQSWPHSGDTYVVYYDDRDPSGYKCVAKDVLSGTVFGVVPKSLAGIERLCVAGLNDGTIAWTNTHFHKDGSVGGTYTTQIYIARPTEIGALSSNDEAVAASASRSSFPTGSSSAVVVCRDDAAGVLAAAGLSADRPVLLTSKTSLPAVSAAELRRLGVTNATIVGGTRSVSATVKRQIDAILAGNAARASLVASDTNSGLAMPSARHAGRYSSPLTVASAVMRRPGWNGTAIVAGAGTISDAAAAAPLAAAKGMPLFLAPRSGLSAKAIKVMRSRGVKRVIVVGNSKAVPQSVVTKLRKALNRPVVRVSGADAAATAAAIAQYGVAHFGMTWNGLGIAPTAVSSNVTIAALARGKAHTVLLLTDGRKLSGATASKLRKVRSRVRRLSYVAAKRIAKTVRGQVRAIVH